MPRLHALHESSFSTYACWPEWRGRPSAETIPRNQRIRSPSAARARRIWSIGRGSESTRCRGTEASIRETSVEPQRDPWSTNPRGARPGSRSSSAVDGRLLPEEQTERRAERALHGLHEGGILELDPVEPAPLHDRLLPLVHADRQPAVERGGHGHRSSQDRLAASRAERTSSAVRGTPCSPAASTVACTNAGHSGIDRSRAWSAGSSSTSRRNASNRSGESTPRA